MLLDHGGGFLAKQAGNIVRIATCYIEGQMTQSQAARRDRELYEKSVKLRMHSQALLQESENLREYSRSLRIRNENLADRNCSPNTARKRDRIQELALRIISPPVVSESGDVVAFHMSHKLRG